jgi:hypothetical protein
VNEGDSINLLRGSALGSNEGFILQLVGSFKQLKEQGFNILDIYTKVEAPAIQVIPIAIYV